MKRNNNTKSFLGIGEYKSIDAFVEAKVKRLSDAEKTYHTLFELIFSERDNVMYEYSQGYRIVEVTYGRAREDILRRAQTLKGLISAAPGSTIALCMENSLEWIEIFWSILACGYRPLLLNLRLSDELLRGALADTAAAAVVSEGKSFDIPTIPAESVVISDTPIDSDVFGNEILVMSSGTSSSIEICAYTAENMHRQILNFSGLVRECSQIKKHYEGRLKLLTFLPFYHVFGLIAVYMCFSFFSRTLVQLNDLGPNTILNTIKRHKVTHLFAVPLFWETVYDRALQTIRSRGDKTYKKFIKGLKIADSLHDVPILGKAFIKIAMREVRDGMFGESILFMITGGSNISPDVVAFFNNIGYRLADGYGMTEIGITSVEVSPRKRFLNGCYVGKPMSETEYRINDAGELEVRGKSMASYIIKNGVKKDNDDWYNTRDMAQCDNGHYRILGRMDDLIVTGNGENINPNLFEPAFNIPGVTGACLIRSEQGGAAHPVLLISVERGLGNDAFDKLDTKVRETAASVSLPGEVRIAYVAEPLLKGNEFKLNRRRLAADYDAGRLTERDRNAVEEEVDAMADEIRRLFATALNRDEKSLRVDADFFLDEGGTSLDYFALITKIGEDYSVTLSPDMNLKTVKQVCDYIKAEKNNVDKYF